MIQCWYSVSYIPQFLHNTHLVWATLIRPPNLLSLPNLNLVRQEFMAPLILKQFLLLESCSQHYDFQVLFFCKSCKNKISTAKSKKNRLTSRRALDWHLSIDFFLQKHSPNFSDSLTFSLSLSLTLSSLALFLTVKDEMWCVIEPKDLGVCCSEAELLFLSWKSAYIR